MTTPRISSRPARPRIVWARQRGDLLLALALTFTTGIVDAAGYLGLDRVFTGNMTGNVVVLGMAIVGADGLQVLGPCLALGGFVAGAAFGGRRLRGRPRGGATPHLLFACSGTALVTMGVLLCIPGATGTDAVRLTATTGMGMAMGLQAATARFVAVKDITTVVVTSTLVGMAADRHFNPDAERRGPERPAAILLLTVGALIGAACTQWHVSVGLLVAGLVDLVAVGLTTLFTRRAS